MNRYILVFFSASSQSEAQKIAKELLEKRLIACATLYNPVTSLYVWKAEIETSQEVEVILKTKNEYFSQIKEHIEKNSSYDTPQILKVAIEDGNKKYLQWMDESLD